MTRSDVGAAMQQELGKDAITLLPIVELGIIGDPVHAWGGIGELFWNGKTWLGVGDMGEIGTIQADSKGSIPSLDISLLGIEPDLLAAATEQKYRGQSGKVWLACFDGNMTMVGEPALYFAGEISTMSLIDASDRRIKVIIDSRMAILKQNKPRYRTDEDHQRNHPGDLFFNLTPAVINKTIYWGLKAPSPTYPTGRSHGGSYLSNSRSLTA